MKFITLAAILCITTGNPASFAQSAPSPKNPVLPRAPVFASWTIQFKYKAENKETAPASQTDFVQSLTVTKTNKTYREVIVYKSGKTQEKWIFEGLELMKTSETNGIVPIAPSTAESLNPDWADYSHSDFKRFEWISLACYKGVKSYQDKPAYAFESVSSDGKPLIAYLSAKTQFPLFCSDWETTRLYTYNPAPTEPLIPPKDFLDTIERYKRGIEALKFHASPP